jgi:hypothetical protein
MHIVGLQVPEIQIDHHLISWGKIKDQTWGGLLLGNGFSINISPRFKYSSLYEVAKREEVEPSLDENCIALFERLGSCNFEDVLRVLFHARLVDEQLGSPQRTQIDALYNCTKNALAAAVTYSHVPPGFPSLAAINHTLRSFGNIFTTNYDLIPYWAIMHADLRRFKDLFWGESNTFDPKDTSVDVNSCVIHYLHGAIHLVELQDGKTKKLTANGVSSLTGLFDLAHPEYFPLFISEGSSERKLSRINRNDYLRFSFEKLQRIDGNLVVIGHSLDKDYDQHIIDALRDGDLTSIAIGVWPHQNAEQIVHFKSRILVELPRKNVLFFDSTTHPLGNSGLSCEA